MRTLDEQTVAEKAIRTALIEVMDLGEDEVLTDAVILLKQALHKVTHYIENDKPQT
jgi:hypothetical protein